MRDQAQRSMLLRNLKATRVLLLLMLVIFHGLCTLPRRAGRSSKTHADAVTTVEAFADEAYDGLSTLRGQWHIILEDLAITRSRRNTVTGVIARPSVLMQLCIELGKMADTLDDESHNATPTTAATELYELSLSYLPKEQE